MEIAIQTALDRTTVATLRDVWQAADALGFRAAFTFDHLVPLNPGERPGEVGGPREGQVLEGWVTLAALGAATQRLHVGCLVTGVTYRNPGLLAKMAVTLDHATDGRAILGLGAGWHVDEHRMYGYEFPPAGERMGRLDEVLTIFHRLCTEDAVTFEGTYYRLDGAYFEPKPVRAAGIPVLVGGSGPRLRRIAGRHATIYSGFAAPWEWPEVNAEVDRAAAAAGRDSAAIERSVLVSCELSRDAEREAALVAAVLRRRGGTEDDARRRTLVGTADDMRAVLRAYEDAGVQLAILNLQAPHDPAQLEWFAGEVLAA